MQEGKWVWEFFIIPDGIQINDIKQIPREFINALGINAEREPVRIALSALDKCRGIKIRDLENSEEFHLYTYLQGDKWKWDILHIKREDLDMKLLMDYPLFFHYELLTLLVFEKVWELLEKDLHTYFIFHTLFTLINITNFYTDIWFRALLLEFPEYYHVFTNREKRKNFLSPLHNKILEHLGKYSRNKVLKDKNGRVIITCVELNQVRHWLN